jgi:hypothetical protein
VAARAGGISSIKVGDTVMVAAKRSGTTLTAVMVGERPDRDVLRDRGTAPGATPAPSTSTGGASSTA